MTPFSIRRSTLFGRACAVLGTTFVVLRSAFAADTIPRLTEPVNDFAHVVDSSSAAEMDRMIRALQATSGDVVVVATVPSIAPYGGIEEYAVKMFENGGRGIGAKGKDNGALILLALKERKVRIEVGYDLEQFVTDGFAGETSREYMAPLFRQGQYGPGLVAGVERVVGRVAQGRNVSIQGVRVPRTDVRRPASGGGTQIPFWVILLAIIVFMIIGRIGGGRRGPRFWGGGPWSGWSSGVGPFGGFGGGGGGGFGGGFGGFGGGRSGGGGGGASW
jgi:uncharacterized protein